jgi:hypothetical protein
VCIRESFIDFKNAYDSVRREVLYNILIEFGVPMKPVRLIQLCLEYAIRRVQESQVGLKLNGAHQLLAYTDDVNLLADNIDAINKTQKLLFMLVRRLV